jgi:hypothetical protein
MLMNIQRVLLIATVAEASATGCGTPTQPMPWDGLVRVSGAVRDFRTNDPVAGAHVTVGDYTGNPVTRDNITTTTDRNGNYSLTLPAGEQFLYVDGEWVGAPFLKDRTYRGDLFVHDSGCIARYGTVQDSVTRQSVANATASVSGVSARTDNTGWFILNLGCPGTMCIGFNTTEISVTHPDYQNRSFPAGRGICGVERVDYDLIHR